MGHTLTSNLQYGKNRINIDDIDYLFKLCLKNMYKDII
jgi:hypothetical protein